MFNQTLDNLPDSVEQIRITQNYLQTINKLPKNLKIFNVVCKDTMMFYDVDIDDDKMFPHQTVDYQMYNLLENKFPNVKFIY